MGFSKLRIVASDVHLRDEAQWVAHGAQALLAQAETFDTLDAALADLDLVVATTARQRGTFHRYLAPAEVCVQIENKRDSLSKVGILFGCEASGLSNEQIAQAVAYTSDNTDILDVDQVKEKLLSVDYVQQELKSWEKQ